MTDSVIKDLIKLHSKWLKDNTKGIKLYLAQTDLKWENLNYCNLTCATIQETDLSDAQLTGSMLNHTNIMYSTFKRAIMISAKAIGACFKDVNLQGVNLSYADLTDAQFINVDLTNTNLLGARLQNVSFKNVKLKNTILKKADLRDATFINTDLTNIIIDYMTVGIHPAPEGDLIGWGKKNGYLVKLLIPAKAKRSCATTRKHRAEYAKVIWIEDSQQKTVVNNEYGETVYEVGQIVRCHKWDNNNRWKECTDGIHFFLTLEEAKAWPYQYYN